MWWWSYESFLGANLSSTVFGCHFCSDWSCKYSTLCIICVMCVLVFYASQCEVLLGNVFASCHGYISPNIYQQQCRYQACRCGSSCLCTALAHYAYLCTKHGISINFRSHVSECGKCLPFWIAFISTILWLCLNILPQMAAKIWIIPKCR